MRAILFLSSFGGLVLFAAFAARARNKTVSAWVDALGVLLFIAALSLAATSASAQEPWPSQTATAAQVEAAETARLIYNAETCRERQLPVGCTQAQVDASSSPIALAPNTAAGRAAVVRGFITRYTPAATSPFVVRIKKELKWNSWTQPKRDDYCVSVLEKPADCNPFSN